jgi:hypothetical protein
MTGDNAFFSVTPRFPQRIRHSLTFTAGSPSEREQGLGHLNELLSRAPPARSRSQKGPNTCANWLRHPVLLAAMEGLPMFATFESSAFLRWHWNRINTMAFEGALNPIADIGWQNLGDELDAAGIYGGFSSRSSGIGITHELRRAEEIGCDVANLGEEDVELFCAVLGLVAHETAHQAAHQFEGDAVSHGEAFVRHASKIAEATGLPEVNLRNAAQWPYVMATILRERRRDGGSDAET